MSDDKDLMLLFQLADSAFPVGGFAYSYGLESATKLGFIRTQEDLRHYLITFSEQIISFDFPFVSEAFRLNQSGDLLCGIRELLFAYEAMLMNPPLKKSSGVIGRNWLRISKQFCENEALEALDTMFLQEQLTFDFPVVFGLTMNIMKIKLYRMLYLFFYMALRDQISALIRLGSAGPSRAHIELQFILDLFAEKISSYVPVSYKHSYKSAYLLEIAQLSHNRVYSKLFQN